MPSALFGLGDDEAAFAALSGSDALAIDGGSATEISRPEVWEAPGPVADAFYWSNADIVGIRGPVGSGKTTTHLRSRIRRAYQMPRSTKDGIRHYKVVIARETYRQLWATTIPSWWDVMPKKLGKWSGGRGDPVTHMIDMEDQFGPIRFIAEFMAFGSSPSEIDANIRGVQCTDLALEEADTNPVAVFTRGLTRIDRYPSREHFDGYAPELRTYGQCSMSYNAPDEENWVVRTIEGQMQDGDREAKKIRESLDEEGIKIEFHRQPGFGEDGCENLQNLAEKYYPRAMAGMRAEGRGNDIDRLIRNKIGYIRTGDPVFQTHVRPKVHFASRPLVPLAGVPLRIGLDQGYFGAAVIGQFLSPFSWRIYAELYFKEGSFAPEFGAALRELLDTRFAGHSVGGAWCDIAGNAKESQEDVTWMSQVSEAARLDIEPQSLGGNRIEPRLAVWRAAMDWDVMGEQGLIIDPSCRLLRRGLENDYVWAQEVDKAENRGRIPKKKGCRAADVIDAGGYMMLSESLPDGRPGTADLIGHNGGPTLDDGRGDDRFDPYRREPEKPWDFDAMEIW